MCKTRAEHIPNTISWFPTKVAMPLASSKDLILASLHDITTNALQHPSPGSPLAPVTDSHTIAALKAMTKLLTGLCTNAPIAVPVPFMGDATTHR
jgi:hypothetical protein